MKSLITTLALCASPTVAAAGDPCPIPIQIHDLGAPNWLEYDRLLEDLESRQPWLGIGQRSAEGGMLIASVHPEGPAASAGLHNSMVITGIDGQSVATTDQQRSVFATLSPGQKVSLTATIYEREVETDVTLGWADPVTFAMNDALRHSEDCITARIFIPTENDRAILRRDLFDLNKRFRCDDAHIALQSRGERAEIDDVYFVRGSRRVMVTMPYWGTACFDKNDLDGESLTDEAALAAIYSVIGDYIEDSFKNP